MLLKKLQGLSGNYICNRNLRVVDLACKIGNANAPVFPDPVCANPITSFPEGHPRPESEQQARSTQPDSHNLSRQGGFQKQEDQSLKEKEGLVYHIIGFGRANL